MSQTRTINWKPFSKKHKTYIKNALKNKMSVAEGAIRSGKTIDHCIIAAMYLETCPDKYHLASGATIGNAKLNIGVCNGYGLEFLFRGRCHWGKYRGNEALFIYTQTGDKVVIFVGGAKADSYKKILGNSYGLWIATEINEHYDSDDSRTSFIKVAFGRQVAAIKPMVLWDLNPSNPGHTIYKDYIDAYKTSYVGGYQYEHFTIADNLSITPERRKEIESQYTVGSVWYRRDILGERCIAEGLIYPMYEKAIEKAPEIKFDVNGNMISGPSAYGIGIDYGTQNAFAAYLFGKFGKVWYILREYYYSGRDTKVQKTDQQYLNDLVAFVMDIDTGRRLEVIIDPSAASFIALLKKYEHRFCVIKADNTVSDGIRETANALDNGYVKICPDCEMLIEEMQEYRWDPDADDDKPIKEKDHGCDAVRYFIKTKHIVREATRRIQR